MASEGHPSAHVNQDESSRDRSNESSGPTSRGESPAGGGRGGSRPPRERHRVRFTPGGESLDESNKRATFDVRDRSNFPSRPKPSGSSSGARISPSHSRTHSPSSFPRAAVTDVSEDITESPALSPMFKPRPPLKGLPSDTTDLNDITKELRDDEEDGEGEQEKAYSQSRARERAERLSRMVGSRSAPGSQLASPAGSPPGSPPLSQAHGFPIDINDIPMENLERRRKYGIEDETDDDEAKDEVGSSQTRKEEPHPSFPSARRLVRAFTGRNNRGLSRVRAPETGLRWGQATPPEDRDPHAYVPPPEEYRGGILSSLLKLYNEQGLGSTLGNMPSGPGVNANAHRRPGSVASTARSSPAGSPTRSLESSGAVTPTYKRQKWYYKNATSGSNSSIANLINSSTMLAQPAGSSAAPKTRPGMAPRTRSNDTMNSIFHKKKKKPRLEDEIRITVHIAETLSRQRYLLELCRALMSYGAPTHRLEGQSPTTELFEPQILTVRARVHADVCSRARDRRPILVYSGLYADLIR